MDIEGRSLTQDRRHRPPQQGDQAAPGLGHGERPDGPGPVHAADEPQRPRGERPRRPPERGRQRRPDRRRQPDGLRLLRPGAGADMGDSAISAVTGPARPARRRSCRSDEDLGPAVGDDRGDDHERPRRLPAPDRVDERPGRRSSCSTFARANGMSTLSMWAIQRDNGGCPGTTGSNDCSGHRPGRPGSSPRR